MHMSEIDPEMMLQLIDKVQNQPTHVPDTFELRKMSLEYLAHAGELKSLYPYKDVELLLQDAQKVYDYLNSR